MRNLLVAMLAVVAVQASPPLLGGYDVVAYFSLPASSNGTMGGCIDFSDSHNDTLTTQH